MRLNVNALVTQTVKCKISDAKIRQYAKVSGVRQLKDERYSLYMRYSAKRTGGTWWLMVYQNKQQVPLRVGRWSTTKAEDIGDVINAATVQYQRNNVVNFKRFETVDQLIGM
ncbi:hypothetical protein [Vibrio coralliilyticus]|uniref:hypothetical protein n=1 Tax=Vibrio coralliilyticus TaxID=190893 RepID=UPI001560D333|nr:hypothetical protein [Vibrio coralliilyticus]NRF63615.1 hypothetical protein [Vibrio coralliilyticus]